MLSIAFTVYSEVSDFVINWWSVDGGGDTWEIAKNILLDTVSTCHENWIIRIEHLILLRSDFHWFNLEKRYRLGISPVTGWS